MPGETLEPLIGPDDPRYDPTRVNSINDNTVPSRLEIRLNGKAIDDIHLKEPGGETLVTHDTLIPAEEFHNYNEISYQFHLYPEKYDKCRFVTDAHLWGTIHNTSAVEVPAELQVLGERITRLRERLSAGDPDMEADEIQAAIDRALKSPANDLIDSFPVAL